MFSTARSASSVSASRTTTGTSVKPRDRAARDPMEARDQLEALVIAADDDRDEHPLKVDRPGQGLDVRLTERADVVRDADLFERELAPGLVGDCGHVVLLWSGGPARLAGRSPATCTPARACHPRVAGRPVSRRCP